MTGKIKNRIAIVGAERGLMIAGIARACDLPYQTVRRQWKQIADGIEYSTFAKLCAGLECKPGDLFQFEPNGHDGDQ
jgi:DNA-binding Xre family transcriptional regulator